MNASKITCGGCGFLSTCNTQLQNIETPISFRETGHCPSNITSSVTYLLVCVKSKREFEYKPGTPRETQIVQQLAQEYNCDAYIPYRIGFSPKEHVELHMDELLKAEIAARAERERQWRDEQRKEDRKWQIAQSIIVFATTGMLGWVAKMLLGL